jgi:predicted metal-dependent hydrolase
MGDRCEISCGAPEARLRVHPPAGHITVSAPHQLGLPVIEAFVRSKLPWIRQQQARLKSQTRETPRKFIERESHHLWARRQLLPVSHRNRRPRVTLDHTRITLSVRPGSSAGKRAEVIHEWHKSLLHQVAPRLIKK